MKNILSTTVFGLAAVLFASSLFLIGSAGIGFDPQKVIDPAAFCFFGSGGTFTIGAFAYFFGL